MRQEYRFSPVEVIAFMGGVVGTVLVLPFINQVAESGQEVTQAVVSSDGTEIGLAVAAGLGAAALTGFLRWAR